MCLWKYAYYQVGMGLYSALKKKDQTKYYCAAVIAQIRPCFDGLKTLALAAAHYVCSLKRKKGVPENKVNRSIGFCLAIC